MIRAWIAAAGLALAASGTLAGTVDFEGTLAPGEDVANLANGSSIGDGLRVSSTEQLLLVRVGGRVDGFFPSDSPLPEGVFGEVFLSSVFDATSNLTLSFDGVARNLSFQIADADFGEVYRAVGRRGGVIVEEITVADGDPGTGDRRAVDVVFSEAVDEILFSGTPGPGTTGIGWGLDNIRYEVVPLPAGLVLTLTALGGLGALRARRKA